MKTTAWADVKARKHSPAEIERIRGEARAELAAMTLRQLREAAGKTQTEVAAAAEMLQSELSRLERREDWLLSTLRRYVEALGGELEVAAVIDGKRVVLAGV